MKLTRSIHQDVVFIDELNAATVSIQRAYKAPLCITVTDTPPTRAVYSRNAVLVAAAEQGLLEGLDPEGRSDFVDDVIIDLSGDLDPIIVGVIPVTVEGQKDTE